MLFRASRDAGSVQGELDFGPADCDVTASGPIQEQILVEMEHEMAIDSYRFADARTDEVVVIAAAPGQCNCCIRSVNSAGEGGITLEADTRVAGQTVIG